MLGEKDSKGLGVDLGIDLNIVGLQSALDELGKALKQSGETATQMVSESVRKIRDAGAGKLKEASQQGGDGDEASKIYKRTMSQLNTAAEKGDKEAKKLISEMNA